MSSRQRLCAVILGTGLVFSVAIVARLQAQDDNSQKSVTAKSAQRSAKRRPARRTRRRAVAVDKSNAGKQESPVLTPKEPSVKPPDISVDGANIDPKLYPNEQRNRNGSGVGTGVGSGEGDGSGYAPGRGSANSSASDSKGGGGMGGGAGAGGGIDYSRTFSAREVDRKARILYKPEPLMSEEAKINNAVGTVVLRATFTASGEVTNIRVVQGLPYGSSENAVKAAQRIKFQPAIKDGRAVSQYIQLEYNFNIY